MITNCTLLCWNRLVYSVTFFPLHLWGWRWSKPYSEWTFLFWHHRCHSLSFSFFSYRYKSSSSGCRPQACAEGTWRGHSSVAQPSCPESHDHSGDMDGKCSLTFCVQDTATIYLSLHFQQMLAKSKLKSLEELRYIKLSSLSVISVSLNTLFTSLIFEKLSHEVKIDDIKKIPLWSQKGAPRGYRFYVRKSLSGCSFRLQLWNIVIGDLKVTEHQIAEELFL